MLSSASESIDGLELHYKKFQELRHFLLVANDQVYILFVRLNSYALPAVKRQVK